MAVSARMRRLASDYEQIKKDFSGHKNIVVTPIGSEPPEKYHVTYYINGIYLLPDGKIETLSRHEVEITLHSDYPRYKPICKILTPIWHPNFRDGQICIGDIWGAGESLTDIIINIGDMIQYKSWNSTSPLCADAAKWAIENKHLFPVGNVDLYIAENSIPTEGEEIDLFDESENTDVVLSEETDSMALATKETEQKENNDNDFEITAEELEGIEFVPTVQRMQTITHAGAVKGKKVNFKTILVKGLLWALIGSGIGFGITEFTEHNITSNVAAARFSGHPEFVEFYEMNQKADHEFDMAEKDFEKWCRKEKRSPAKEDSFALWLKSDGFTAQAEEHLDKYLELDDEADEILYDVYMDEYDGDEDELDKAIASVTRTGTAMWSALIAMFIGLFLGIGEGIYYGSAGRAVKYGVIGAAVSLIIGYASGYLAQWMYSGLLTEDPSDFNAAFVRGLGWAVMGLGIGAGAGLIKPDLKRILFCTLGGLLGAFVGGFLFNYICDIIPDDIVARGAAIVIMGMLIGVGVGLLEQFAKSAWLKVIRGEFEGKEYLVFAGTTSIGNDGKNSIVLFKDKLVGSHHCDIKLEGSKYTLIDCGTPMGTLVNGQRITRHVLRQGDAVAIGNSVLVFNTK